MIGLTEAVIGAALWLLYSGNKKKPASPEKPKTQQTKPAEVKWPTAEPVETREGWPPGKEPTVFDLQSKEAADAARAKVIAKNDPAALLAIRQRERARQKALQDYAAQRKAYEASQK